MLGLDYVAPLFHETIQVKGFDQSGFNDFDRQYQYSAREYNDDSALVKQIITIKKNKPALDDEIVYKQYEYIRQ